MKFKKCKNCDVDFELTRAKRANVFCSQSCANSFTNKQRQPMSDEIKKKISDGLKKTKDMRILAIAKVTKNKHKGDISSILEVSSRTCSKILKRLNLGCCVCEWKEDVCDIHHIHGRKIENADSHDNLTYLCPNHHRLAHKGKIPNESLIPLSIYFPKDWKELYYG